MANKARNVQVQGQSTDRTKLFDVLTVAQVSHRAELDEQQMFYFLRGVLWQWCVDNTSRMGMGVDALVLEMEATFMQDIRYLALSNYQGISNLKERG